MAKYFNENEIKGLKPHFVEWLDTLREALGSPIFINSGYRSPSHPIEAKKEKPGAHSEGLAVDIRCKNSRDRYKLVSLALSMGCNRVGIAPSFVHIDLSKTRSKDVIWLY